MQAPDAAAAKSVLYAAAEEIEKIEDERNENDSNGGVQEDQPPPSHELRIGWVIAVVVVIVIVLCLMIFIRYIFKRNSWLTRKQEDDLGEEGDLIFD